MKFNKIKESLSKKGMHYDAKCYNACRPHNITETYLHWHLKADLFWHLVKQGYSVFTEFPIGKAVCDLYVLDEDWDIEVETQPSPQAYGEKKKLLQNHHTDVWIFDASQITKGRDYDEVLHEFLDKLGLKEVEHD